jgi:hypothetical protein
LKLLFDPDTLKLLGVHLIGDRAAEIVHIGQAVLTLGGTLEYFRDTVFNYPTLAEAYKVAALDGLLGQSRNFIAAQSTSRARGLKSLLPCFSAHSSACLRWNLQGG